MPAPAVPDRQQSFRALRPAIQAHARAALDRLRPPLDQEDAETEVIARTWVAFRRTPTPRAATAARLAAPAVASILRELARARR